MKRTAKVYVGGKRQCTGNDCAGAMAILQPEGNWLRLWNSLGVGVAHDTWVGTGGLVHENSGPGEFVRRNWLANVLAGRKVIDIVLRTTVEGLPSKADAIWRAFEILESTPGSRMIAPGVLEVSARKPT